MKTVGIIGFGSFGKFLAERLDSYCKVLVYSKGQKPNKWLSSLSEVGQADYIILSIPLSAYHETLTGLKQVIKKGAVIVDVCSVKEEPVRIIKQNLPACKIVATHPLFGPESAADSLQGHVIVLCPEVSDAAALKSIDVFCKMLGLDVKEMTAKEHDEEMATVQGLTFFIARVLKDVGIHAQKLSTPSFRRLLHLAELESSHSEDLFYTIQKGNSHIEGIRHKFISTAQELNEAISRHEEL